MSFTFDKYSLYNELILGNFGCMSINHQDPPYERSIALTDPSKVHLLVIVKDGHFATYINDQPYHYFEYPDYSLYAGFPPLLGINPDISNTTNDNTNVR